MKSVASPFTKVCVYDRPHGDVKTAFSRIRMYAFTDVNVYVWAGPEIITKQTIAYTQRMKNPQGQKP